MLSIRHAQLIAELEAKTTRSYLEEVLLACLFPLRDGGPTSWDEVTVHDAWTTDDYLAVIYTSPWGPKVGVVHTPESLALEKPEVAGLDLANFSIAEPLGSVVDHLRYDANGLGWYGDLESVGGFPAKPAQANNPAPTNSPMPTNSPAPTKGTGQRLVPGIIGMSVHTDCVYLQEINRAVEPEREPQISSVRLALQRVDFRALTEDFRAGRSDAVEQTLRRAIASVQNAGADFLVLTANTMHSMLGQMSDTLQVPVLNITRPVFHAAREQRLSRPGLLSTLGTLESGTYQAMAADYGCTVITPPEDLAKAINEAIFTRLVRGIRTQGDIETVLAAVDWFAAHGADSVILGCTDLTLLIDQLTDAALPLLDSTVLHARAARYVASTGDIDRYLG